MSAMLTIVAVTPCAPAAIYYVYRIGVNGAVRVVRASEGERRRGVAAGDPPAPASIRSVRGCVPGNTTAERRSIDSSK